MIKRQKRRSLKQTRLLKFAIIAAIILVAAFLMQKIGVSELRELIGEHVLFAPMIYVLCFAILADIFISSAGFWLSLQVRHLGYLPAVYTP